MTTRDQHEYADEYLDTLCDKWGEYLEILDGEGAFSERQLAVLLENCYQRLEHAPVDPDDMGKCVQIVFPVAMRTVTALKAPRFFDAQVLERKLVDPVTASLYDDHPVHEAIGDPTEWADQTVRSEPVSVDGLEKLETVNGIDGQIEVMAMLAEMLRRKVDRGVVRTFLDEATYSSLDFSLEGGANRTFEFGDADVATEAMMVIGGDALEPAESHEDVEWLEDFEASLVDHAPDVERMTWVRLPDADEGLTLWFRRDGLDRIGFAVGMVTPARLVEDDEGEGHRLECQYGAKGVHVDDYVGVGVDRSTDPAEAFSDTSDE